MESNEIERIFNKFDQTYCENVLKMMGIFYHRYEMNILKKTNNNEEDNEQEEDDDNIDEENYFERLSLGLNSLQVLSC